MELFDLLGPPKEDTPTKNIPEEEEEDGDRGLFGLYVGKYDRGLTWVATRSVDAEDEDKQIYVASTGTPDRMSDIVEQSTLSTRNFKANPVILADHNVPVVGRSLRVVRTKGGEDGTRAETRTEIEWDMDPTNPMGILIGSQHIRRFRNALSIGFLPKSAIYRADLPVDHYAFVDARDTPKWQAGMLYRHSDLLEISSVGVPANPEALRLNMETAYHDTEEAVNRYLGELLDNKLKEAFKSAFRNDEDLRAVIKAVVLSSLPTLHDSGLSGQTKSAGIFGLLS